MIYKALWSTYNIYIAMHCIRSRWSYRIPDCLPEFLPDEVDATNRQSLNFFLCTKNINQANEAPPRYASNPSAPSSKYERWPRCTLLAPKGAFYVMMCLNMIMMFLYMIMMRLDISNFNPPQTLTIYGDIIPVMSTVNHMSIVHVSISLLLSHGSSKITYSV